MEQEHKIVLILLIIVFIIVVSIFAIKGFFLKEKITLSTAKCIGNNSLLYYSEICSHCKTQKSYFGDYFSYINKTDCLQDPDSCKDIYGTPSWRINGTIYEGIQSIKRLKELTGC